MARSRRLSRFSRVSTGGVQAFTLHLLGWTALDAINRKGADHIPSFRSLTVDALGSVRASVAVEVVVATGCFGTACSLLLVIGELCPQLARALGVPSQHGWLLSRGLWVTLVGVGFDLPLFWQSSLDGLRCFSAVGNMAVIAVAAVTCAFATGALPAPPPEPSAAPLTPLVSSSMLDDLGRLESISLYIFSFSCAFNVPVAVAELRQPSLPRINTAIGSSILLVAVLYALVAWSGSATFGAGVSADLLASLPTGSLLEGCTRQLLVATLARFCMVLNVAASVPLLLHPTRASISQAAFGVPAVTLSSGRWAALSLTIFACSWAVAVSVRSLDLVMGMVGALTGVPIGFTFPCLLYVRMEEAARAKRMPGERTLSIGEVDEQGALEHREGAHLVTRYAAFQSDEAVFPRRARIAGARVVGACSLLLLPMLVAAQCVKLAQSLHSSD